MFFTSVDYGIREMGEEKANKTTLPDLPFSGCVVCGIHESRKQQQNKKDVESKKLTENDKIFRVKKYSENNEENYPSLIDKM